MPKFTFTSPAGKKYKVNAPEGATQDDALNYLVQNNPDFGKELQAGAIKDSLTDPLRSAKMDPAKLEEFKGKSALEKTMINVGVGGKAAIRGAKQVVGLNDETPEELIRAGNEAQQLAQAQGKLSGPLAQATGTVGLTTPLALVPGNQSTLATALMQGLAGGALTPSYNPEQVVRDKLQDAAIGGATGVGLQGLINTAKPFVRSIAPALSRSAADAAAGRTTMKEIGGKQNAPMLIQALRGADEMTPIGTPQTAQMAAGGDANLAALERSSRLNPVTAGEWNKADLAANEVRANYLRNLVGDMKGNVSNAEKARTAATAAQRDLALASGNRQSQDIGSQAIAGLAGINSGDEAVNRLLDNARRRLRQNPDASEVYSIRKSLTDSGLTSNGAVMEAVGRLDDALESRIGPKWREYLDRYSTLSGPVNEAEAKLAIGSKVFDPNSGSPVGRTFGGQPMISGDALSNALKTHGFNEAMNRPNMRPEVRAQFQALIDEERAARLPQDMVAANAVDTGAERAVSDALATAIAAKVGGPGPVMSTLNRVTGQTARAKAMGRLLRNPNKLADVLEEQLKGGTNMYEDLGRNALTEYLRSQ